MQIGSIIHAKSYEKLLYKIRRHPITFIPGTLLIFVILVLPIGLYWLLASNFEMWMSGPAGFPITILFGSIYYLFSVLYFYTYFIDFYLDMMIVTNDRIIDIDQIGLFGRTIAEVDLYQIQDATSEVRGIFATMFNYGNLIIQTAGAIPKFTLHNISRPHYYRQMILDLVEEDRKYHAGQK